MKKLTFLLCLFLIVFTCSIQAQDAILFNEKSNILYLGVDNPFNLKVEGIPCEELTLEGDVTIIRTYGKGCQFIIRSDKENVTTMIKIYHERAEGKTLIEEKLYRTKFIPRPIAGFAGRKLTDSTITKIELKSGMGVLAYLYDFPYDTQMRVTSFRMSLYRQGELMGAHSSDSNRVTSDQESLLSNVKLGDEFVIDKIMAKGPVRDSIKLDSMHLIVN